MGDNDGMTTPPEHRLLAVFAHPDDETIGAGGLLALAVAAGVDVSVVTCTRGEQGEVIPPELGHLTADPDRLARRREQELSAALAELGVHRLLLLDQVPGLDGARPARFRDSGMRWVRPGIAGTVLAEATSALLVQRWLLTGEPVDEAYADEVLDTVLLPLLRSSAAA